VSLNVDFDRGDIAAVMSAGDPPDADWEIRTGIITFDDSYASGGESLTATMLQMASVTFVHFATANGRITEYDYANSKALVYYSDSDGVADGPLVAMTASTDLSGHAVRFLALGKPTL
jgi:hypothetical protein